MWVSVDWVEVLIYECKIWKHLPVDLVMASFFKNLYINPPNTGTAELAKCALT